MEEFLKKREEELQFDMKHSREVPDFSKNSAPVKLTTAAVYRESHQLRLKEEQEQKKLKDFEMNLRDEREYERWKREMGEKEQIEEMERVQKKKIEMEMAREEAMEAQKRKEKENKMVVEVMKGESEIRLIELEE